MFNNRSRREKLILIAGVLSVCAFAIIKLIAVPMYDVNKLNLHHIQSKTLFIKKYKELLSQKEFYDTKYHETKRILSNIKRSFLDASKPSLAAAKLQRILDDQAARSSVKITRAKIEKSRLNERIMFIPVEITLRSSLKNLSRFVQLVENHPKFLIIEDFSTRRVDRNDPELLETRLLVHGFIKQTVNEETKGI